MCFWKSQETVLVAQLQACVYFFCIECRNLLQFVDASPASFCMKFIPNAILTALAARQRPWPWAEQVYRKRC